MRRSIAIFIAAVTWACIAVGSVHADTGPDGSNGYGSSGTSDINPMRPGGVLYGTGAYGNGCAPMSGSDPGALAGAQCPPRRPAPVPAPAPPAPGGVPAPVGVAPPPPTPTEIATGIAGTLPLATLTPRTSPRASRLLVGFPTWLWLEGWAPRSATLGTITVTATPVSARWDLVDKQLTCAGPGRPYRPGVDDPASRSECSATFSHSSASQPDRVFHAHVVITWHVAFTDSAQPAAGPTQLPSRTSTLPLTLAVTGYHAVHD